MLMGGLANTYVDDWSSFKGGNIPKLGLSVLTIIFDTLFIIQHYVLYRKGSDYEALSDALLTMEAEITY